MSSQFWIYRYILEEYLTSSSKVCSLYQFFRLPHRLSWGQQRIYRNQPILQTRAPEPSQLRLRGSSRSNFSPKQTLHWSPILVVLLSQTLYLMASIFLSFLVLVEVSFTLGVWILNLNLPSSALLISSRIWLPSLVSKEEDKYLQFFLAMASTKLSQMMLSLEQKFKPRNVWTLAIVRNRRRPELQLWMKGKLKRWLTLPAFMSDILNQQQLSSVSND